MNKELQKYQLVYTDKTRKDMLEASSKEELFFLARHVADECRKFSWEAIDALENLLGEIHTSPNAQAAVLIERVPQPEKKILDIFVFFTTDNLPLEEDDDPDSVTQHFHHLRDQLTWSSVAPELHRVPQGTYHSIEQFLALIPSSLPEIRSIRVLGCLKTDRIKRPRNYFNGPLK